jgi:hypothetical protein
MNEEQTSKIVRALFAAADRVPSKEIFIQWHDALKRVDYEPAVTAARKFRSSPELRYGVTLGSFLESMIEVPAADEAFHEIRLRLNYGRGCVDDAWSHPLVEMTVGGRTGFLALCDSEEGTIDWKIPKAYENARARFMREATHRLSETGDPELPSPQRLAITESSDNAGIIRDIIKGLGDALGAEQDS